MLKAVVCLTCAAEQLNLSRCAATVSCSCVEHGGFPWILNTYRKCSRAGLVVGKLLISQFIRRRKRFRRADGRSVVFRSTSGLFQMTQAAAFGTALCWLYSSGRFAIAFQSLQLIGKMTLTNYLLQNLLALFLFSGFGLGLLHRRSYAFTVEVRLSCSSCKSSSATGG